MILGPHNKEYFEHYVQLNDHTVDCEPINKKIRTAYKLFDYLVREEIKDDVLGGLKKLSKLITENVSISVVMTSEKLSFIFFDRLNTRGKALVVADLMKNHLFSRLSGDSDPLKTKWTNMVVEFNKYSIDDPTDFIRCYWNSINEKVSKSNLYSDFSKNYSEYKIMKKFFDGLFNSRDLYLFLYKGAPMSGFTSKIKEYVNNLRKLSNKTFYPLIIAMQNNSADNSEIENVLKHIECLAIRNLVTHGNPNVMEELYASLAKDYSKGKIDEKHIIKSIDELLPSDAEIRNKFVNFKIKSDDEGKVILRSMYNHVHIKGELIVDPDGQTVHLEHIMPQNKGEWEISDEVWSKYLNYLGNTTLLLGQKNIKLKNKPFAEKKKLYSESTISYTSDLCKIEKWDEVEIEKNQMKYLEDFLLTWPNNAGN